MLKHVHLCHKKLLKARYAKFYAIVRPNEETLRSILKMSSYISIYIEIISKDIRKGGASLGWGSRIIRRGVTFEIFENKESW